MNWIKEFGEDVVAFVNRVEKKAMVGGLAQMFMPPINPVLLGQYIHATMRNVRRRVWFVDSVKSGSGYRFQPEGQ